MPLPRSPLPATDSALSDNPTASPSQADNSPPRAGAKPIKDRPSSCGLAHCTVYSISRRSRLSRPPGLMRRETEQTFFIHNFFQTLFRPFSITCREQCPKSLVAVRYN
jgi:hypothetical protein